MTIFQPNRSTLTGESLTGESLTGESLTGESLTGESLTGESLTGESPLPDAGQPETMLHLPGVAEILKVRCCQQEQASSPLFRFGEHQQYAADLVERNSSSTLPAHWKPDESCFTLLLFHPPQQPVGTKTIQQVQKVQNWMDATTAAQSASLVAVRSILLPLQGVHIIWQPGRAAVFADEVRLEAVVKSLIEANFFEQELRRIECEIDRGWEQTQVDSGLAFEFNERHLPLKVGLETRFQAVLSLRIALARLTPQIMVPHVYPPTIASQLGERLRERTRMPERLELVDEKLSAQERVYDHCSQRAGEYIVARKGHMLEWVIIILLFLQTVLWVVDLLSSVSE